MSEANEETTTAVGDSDDRDETVPEGAICSVEESERMIEAWAKAMGLSSKLDESGLFPDEVSALRKAKRDLQDAILQGHLVLDAESRFVFTPYDVGSDAKLGKLVFDEPDMAMLRKAKTYRNAVEAQTHLLQGMTKADAIKLGKMKNRNAAVCTAIVSLFLG
jgi:hypothetical protein